MASTDAETSLSGLATFADEALTRVNRARVGGEAKYKGVYPTVIRLPSVPMIRGLPPIGAMLSSETPHPGPMHRRRRCAGFTLLEVVVTLAILSLLAAATLPTLKSAMDRSIVRDTADRLQALRDGIFNPDPAGNAFFQQVGAYPGRLHQLSQPIVSANAAVSPNSCGGSFNNGQVNGWTPNGPFVKYAITPGVGVGTAMGRIDDVLTRIPPNGGAGELRMTMSDAEVDLVVRLDQELNAGDGPSAGSIQWTPAVGSVTVLNYVLPIGNKC